MARPYEAPPPLPAENGVHVWRAAIVVPIVTFVFVALRFYTRLCLMRRKPTIDDYIIAATMVISIVHAVLMGIATYHGMGLHTWQFTPELNSEYYLWIGITSQFYVVGLAGFKSALILLYMQTFGLVSKRFRIACYLTLFYTLGYLTANLFAEFLGCWPIAKKWHADLPGSCIDRKAANTFFGIGHVTSDLIIAILPLPPIWRLTFPTTRQKIGLSLTLSSGCIAWAVATVRYVISTYNQSIYDRPWWAGISFTFSILEVNTGLICACVPTFTPLLSAISSTRRANFISNWTKRASIVWHNRSEKQPWDDWDSEARDTLRREATPPDNKGYSSHGSSEEDAWGDLKYHANYIVESTLGRDGGGDSEKIADSSVISVKMMTFSPVTPPGEDVPPCDLAGLQAIAERDQVRYSQF